MIGFTALLNSAQKSSIRSEEGVRIIVWNLTKSCNLSCRHCYIEAGEDSGELTEREAKALVDHFSSFGIKIVLFSGGEPLLYPHIFQVARYAKEKGIECVLSSNGTLITEEMAKRIKETFSYVGISIDGRRDTHNWFRGDNDAFDKAIRGFRLLYEHRIKRGLRFTINKHNADDLPALLTLFEKEKIERFCMYHLVYAGKAVSEDDISREKRVWAVNLLAEMAKGEKREILTTDNPADGVFLCKEKGVAEDAVREWGGCSAGVKILAINPKGWVFPCQFWQEPLGNIREKSLETILKESSLVKMLKKKERYLKGRCAECSYKDICGGCRVRAFYVHRDLWAEDPACYIS